MTHQPTLAPRNPIYRQKYRQTEMGSINQQILPTYPRKISVRANRATAAGVSDDLDWPDNENRVHGKRYRRINERHEDHY
jgi:hypothetical protein